MAEQIPQSTTIRIPLQAYLVSDHISPATGKTIAITISKNGAAYGNPSGGATNATEIASGSYYVDLSTTDTGTLGPLFVLGTAATIDNVVTIYNVVKATNGGFTGIPDAVAAAVGGLPTIGVTIPNATAGAAGGLFIAGANAPTSITGTSNSAGLTLTGQGTGPGLLATGGATGNAFTLVGGGTSGDGINIATTSGHGIVVAPNGQTKHGLFLTGSGNSLGGACDAARLAGGFSGVGLHALGGVSGGDGIKAEGTAGNANGFTILGFGTGKGILATSGATATAAVQFVAALSSGGIGLSLAGDGNGSGFDTRGGTTGGYGINCLAGVGSNISGMFCRGDGSGAGLFLQGGSSFGGAGLIAHAGSGSGDAGIETTGDGSGAGVSFAGGATGDGMDLLAGGTSGIGLFIQGRVANGVHIQTTNGHGIHSAGGTNGRGINILGAGTGHGILATSGSGATGDGFRAVAASTNGDGFSGIGAGTGVGFRSVAAAVGFGSATTPPTAAAIATAVWQDATAGDFTVSSSIGKSLYTSGAVPGGAGGLFIAGTNAATTVTTSFTTTFTGNLTGSAGSVTGNVGGNVVGTVASVVGAVGSVTGNVGGNVTGNVTGTLGGFTAAALAQFFTLNTTKVYSDAITGSVVKEIATHAAGTSDANVVSVNGTTFSGANVPCILADGVAHGGTPGSSTATLALTALDVSSTSGDAVTFVTTNAGSSSLKLASSDGVGMRIDTANQSVYMTRNNAGTGSGVVEIIDNSNSPGSNGIHIYGGNAGIFLDADMPIRMLSGDGVSGSGDGVFIETVGAGVHGLNITGGSVSGNAINLTHTSGDDIHGRLAANALDLIHLIAPAGPATEFVEALTQLFHRFFPPEPSGEVIKSKSDHTLKTFGATGVPITTQTWTDDGDGTESIGPATLG